MRLPSWRSSAAFSATLAVGIALGVVGQPLWRSSLIALNQSQYGELTFRCDSAMRTHYLAQARIADAPSEAMVGELRQAEIALIDCQDYDMFQKQLLVWGLSESDLGLMRLNAIEADARGLPLVVEAHEIHD